MRGAGSVCWARASAWLFQDHSTIASTYSGPIRRMGPTMGAVAAPSKRHHSAALVIAMALLVGAGAIQELFLLAGRPGLGIAAVLPALVAVAWLWRPGAAVLALVALTLGLELLLPLHTGGGRYQDWLLHYELALHYAGLPGQVQPAYLVARTPLFHQLLAAFLAHERAYWVFQVGAVLLNSLWLWPAALLIRRQATGGTALRLLAVGLTPVILAYSTYTWPWNFAAFFLLSALWLADEPGTLAQVGTGLGLGGALLAHPGTLGYAAGLGAWWLYRRRRGLWAGIIAGVGALATSLPWVFSVTGGRGPVGLFSGSIPASQGQVPLPLWAISRLLLVAHTVMPQPGLPADRAWVNVVLVFLVLSLPGALITLVVATRIPLPPPAVRLAIIGGAAVNLAIFPADAYAVGILNVLYIGIMMYLVVTVAALDEVSVRRLLVVAAALSLVLSAALLWLSTAPAAGDPNAGLRDSYGVLFFIQRWGLVPGSVLLAVALGLGIQQFSRSRAAGAA
jgi:hypothetical protein